MLRRIARVLFRYFVKGMLVVVPLGAACLLIYWAVSRLDSALNLSDILWVNPKTGKPTYIPGTGILSVIIIIMIAGLLVTNVITDPIKRWFYRWLDRLPLFKFLYYSVKDLTEAFVGEEKKFNEPVLVEVNDSGMKRVGFLTQKDLTSIGLPGQVAVYFPWSYSFAGQVSIVPADKIQTLNMSAADAMKFAISGGVSGIH
jgi:uncharacterized membrane protein